MNVKELIAELKNYDPEMEIIVSSDEEGNSFSSLYTIGAAICYQDGNEISLVHPDDIDDYDEDELDTVLVFN